MEEDDAAHTPTSTQPNRLRKGKEAYPCKVCGETFTRAWSLVQHLWKHTGERPFKCRYCGSGFNALTSLRHHQRVKHKVKAVKLEEQKLIPNTDDENRFKCDICGSSYKTRHILLRHRRRQHKGILIANVEEEPLKSDQCGKSDKADEDQLMKHKEEEEEIAVVMKETPQELLANTEEQPFQCDQSDDSLSTNSSFQKQKSWAITGIGLNIECKVCGERFPNNTRLLVHQRLHEGKTIQKCTQCDAEFIWESQLRIHKRMHTGERPFKCDDCGKGFATIGRANVHKRTCQENSVLFMCAHCGCTFTTRRELTIHQVQSLHIGKDNPLKKRERTRDTGRDYDDQVVEAPSGTVRKRIKQEHEGKIIHKCRYCGKEELSHSSLLVHERVHTGERPFRCAYCDLASASLSNLRHHQIKQHPGKKLASLKRDHYSVAFQTPDLKPPTKKPQTLHKVVNKLFKCEYCEKAFRSRSHLQEHTYVHTGKPFYCDICGQGFVRASQLERHQDVCGVSVFRCRPCRRTLDSLDDLLEHKLRHHGHDQALNESDGGKSADRHRKHGCEQCGRSFSDASGLAIHKCDDQSTGKTLTCKDCGTVVQVGGTTLSNVFTVTDLSNVKCFRKNHTLF